ncbi:hypothetical protein BaRGS_00008905 [Batillaria attramentaria]|uniref:TIR domain-containing protein n=1 Tax=Batillaria attramentaria TaxID=370345 RepID=A0ABD0LJV8_9CAEN
MLWFVSFCCFRVSFLTSFGIKHFGFDIFLTYDGEDELWVHQPPMPEMEERLGLKLCIHDFRLGKQILTNLLTLGQRHVMDFRDTLAVVVLEDIPGDALTTEMKAVVETTTYIKWPVNPEARDTFWRRLRANFVDILGMNEERTSTEQRQTENYTPDMEV